MTANPEVSDLSETSNKATIDRHGIEFSAHAEHSGTLSGDQNRREKPGSDVLTDLAPVVDSGMLASRPTSGRDHGALPVEVQDSVSEQQRYPRPEKLEGSGNRFVPDGRTYRRVANYVPLSLRQHRPVAESVPGTAGGASSKTSPVQGFSAFITRVLDQLSLSAWLPAAMLVGSLALLLQLHAQKNRNVGKAIDNLTDKPLGILILLLFAMILATLVTQAFEFEVIRLLEGYWGSGQLASAISRIFIQRQLNSQTRLLGQYEELQVRALREADLPPEKARLVKYIEQGIRGTETRSVSLRSIMRTREARKLDWQKYAPAHLMCRVQAIEGKIDEYPDESRMLPTKLGNVLRSVEDSIKTDPDGDRESYIIRHWAKIPAALQKEHDQYRSRLELYCTLAFVFVALAVTAPFLIVREHHYLLSAAVTSCAYLVMTFVSYTAAIASARGYKTAVEAIDEVTSSS